MTPELEAIKDQLTTRNVIRYAQEARYHVNLVRVDHNRRVLMVTVNGKVIAETVFEGRERLPELLELFKLQKIFNCDREG